MSLVGMEIATVDHVLLQKIMALICNCFCFFSLVTIFSEFP